MHGLAVAAGFLGSTKVGLVEVFFYFDGNTSYYNLPNTFLFGED